ncbi:lipopolysaccharide kinase InaA family protein [Sporohalobacter salinus]|uniref:lipopolysaccharide kinase InaA family protein n=1 Tax=Sporohalobacter salinus TaxID=1494606 RepID=UPI00195F5C06|nr:lipopolysaccharide kinase InaA family protein [Sporohalobacter salinus]MBM7622953.1 hypothetical protein [Sporohalobacter salinus]
MKLNKKRYDEKTTVYHYNKLEQDLVKKSVECLKTNKVNINNLNLVKSANGRKVFKLEFRNKNYYIKKYFYRKISKRIKNLFRVSEAVRASKISNRLLKVGIPVVRPILAITYKRNLWTQDSIFVTEGFNGITLQQYIAYGDYNRKMKCNIIKRVARLWAKFYSENFLNGDPNLASILIKFGQTDFKIKLVDVDNIRYYPSLSWKAILENLADFNAHTYSGLDKMGGRKLSYKDRELFLREFSKTYGRKIDVQKTGDYINRKTVDELIEWDKINLIDTNNELRPFM